jgi:uncharacterized protein with HEPN domain
MQAEHAHAYFDIDLDVIWKTVADELPPMLQAVDAALAAN